MKSIKSIFDIALKYTLQKCIISKDVMLNRHFFLISIASGFSEVYKETNIYKTERKLQRCAQTYWFFCSI